jgi:hypothetical protein
MKTSWLRSPIPDPFVVLAILILCGFVLASRSFAHFGVRPFYIGEIAFAALLVGRPRAILKPWLTSLAVPSQTTAFSWCLTISLCYALLESLRGILAGPFVMQTAEIMAFWVYPLWFFVGAWVGLRHADLLTRFLVPFAWLHGVFGLVYIKFLAPEIQAHAYHASTQVDWFSVPIGAAILLLALVAFEHNPRRAAIPMILNVMVLIGMQRRAEWFALVVALLLWAVLAGRIKRIMIFGFVLMIPLLVGLIPGVRFPSPSLRGEDISTYDILGRVISVFDQSSAAKLTDNAEGHAATATWRSDFWRGIWTEVHSSPATAVFGLGFDFPLWTLHADDLTDSPVRTPHSIFMFVLGYSGWLGVLIFAALQAALGRTMWRTYRVTGEPFGFCLWVLAVAWGLFDPLFETPFGAIPMYMLMGLSMAPAISAAANSLRPKLAHGVNSSLLQKPRHGNPLTRKPGFDST